MHETMNLQFRRTRIIHLIWIEKGKTCLVDVFVLFYVFLYFFRRPKVTKSWLIVGFLVSKSRRSQIVLGSAERCWEPWERMKKPMMLVSSSFIYSLQSYTPTKQKKQRSFSMNQKKSWPKSRWFVKFDERTFGKKHLWTLMKISRKGHQRCRWCGAMIPIAISWLDGDFSYEVNR